MLLHNPTLDIFFSDSLLNSGKLCYIVRSSIVDPLWIALMRKVLKTPATPSPIRPALNATHMINFVVVIYSLHRMLILLRKYDPVGHHSSYRRFPPHAAPSFTAISDSDKMRTPQIHIPNHDYLFVPAASPLWMRAYLPILWGRELLATAAVLSLSPREHAYLDTPSSADFPTSIGSLFLVVKYADDSL